MEKIAGYRELTEDEIWVINALKKLEGMVNSQIDVMKITEADQRLVALAATHLEIGFMFLTKSVAKPERVTDENMDRAAQVAINMQREHDAKEDEDGKLE